MPNSDFTRGDFPLKILTTTIKTEYPRFGQQTELLPGWQEEVQRVWKTKRNAPFLSDLRWAFRLFFASKNYDAVLTGFERPAWLFALLRRVTLTRTPTHVFVDVYPVLPRGSVAAAIRQWLFRQIFLSADCVVAFSKKQRDMWSSLFKIPPSHFEVIPYWATASLRPLDEPVLGEYIFAGGDEDRDYRTLIEAMRDTPYRVIIAALRRDHFGGVNIPPNVEIKTVPHDEFVKLIGGAGLVVVPLRANTIRFAGQQTYLNAMLLKKPVIVADDGAGEYIENGRTGIIVAPGDAQELATAIGGVMSNSVKAFKMGQLAHEAAQNFTAKRYFDSVFEKTTECVAKRKAAYQPSMAQPTQQQMENSRHST
jgi:glycosyltransferase involved in cell wall biosynthesis